MMGRGEVEDGPQWEPVCDRCGHRRQLHRNVAPLSPNFRWGDLRVLLDMVRRQAGGTTLLRVSGRLHGDLQV